MDCLRVADSSLSRVSSRSVHAGAGVVLPSRVCFARSQQLKPLRRPGPQHRAGLLARQPSEDMENKCQASLPHGKGLGGLWDEE